MDNAFDKEHRIRCFNHTIQLSAKTLLRPFNAGIKAANDSDNDGAAAEEVALEDFDEDEDEDEDVTSKRGRGEYIWNADKLKETF